MSSVKHFSDWLIRNKVKSITDDLLEKYLLELKENKKRSISTMKQTIAAIKFVFSDVLEQKVTNVLNIRLRMEEKIPVVLSEEEVGKILNSVQNLKHKTILMIVYLAGLRLSELLFIQVQDIDFDRIKNPLDRMEVR